MCLAKGFSPSIAFICRIFERGGHVRVSVRYCIAVVVESVYRLRLHIKITKYALATTTAQQKWKKKFHPNMGEMLNDEMQKCALFVVASHGTTMAVAILCHVSEYSGWTQTFHGILISRPNHKPRINYSAFISFYFFCCCCSFKRKFNRAASEPRTSGNCVAHNFRVGLATLPIDRYSCYARTMIIKYEEHQLSRVKKQNAKKRRKKKNWAIG